MYCSAKRGLAIVCLPSLRLSVRSSVCDVGGSWSHRLKILETIAPTINPAPLHLCSSYSKGYPLIPMATWGNLWETRGGVEKKWRAGAQKRHLWNISETRKDRGKVTMDWRRLHDIYISALEILLLTYLYRNSPMPFRTVPFPTPYAQLPYIGGLQPHPKLQSKIARKRVHIEK